MLPILLVDDNEIERTTLREIMKAEADWEVIESGDGHHALDLLCDGLRPHLCIFDMNMPKLSGLELLQRMRRDLALRHLHVVIATATRDRDSVLALAKLGIDGFLLKPHNSASTLPNLRQVIRAIPVIAAPLVATRNLLNKTVLVVEDDLVERTAICAMIKAEPGWDVVEAAGGSRALDLLHTQLAPDLCLIDLRMPQMDGLTLVQKIRADLALARLPIVILSGEQDRGKIISLSKLGISGYLLKPANPAKLRAVLRAITGLPAESAVPTTPVPSPITPPAPAIRDEAEPADTPAPASSTAEPAPVASADA